jgi:hypothetical protein
MRMKRFHSIIAVMCIFCLPLFTGCDEDGATTARNVDKKVQSAIAKSIAEAISKYGTPSIKNFAEMKLAKWVYELRDNPKLVCYAYTENKMTGQFHFKGKCLGYGLPYSVQMVNPDKMVKVADYYDFQGIDDRVMKLPQPEPNGLYPPPGLSATFLVMIDAKGKPWPVYIESEITVSPFPLPYAVYPEGADFFNKKKG